MLINFDLETFYWINSQLSNPVFDFILPWLRNKYTWIPLYLFLIFGLPYYFGKKGIYMVVFTILTVSVADLASNYGFKKTVQRLRPCNAELTIPVVERVPCGSGYSFTSSHATNHFAMATFLFLLFHYKGRWVGRVLYFWAFAIAFSQVYVGVHYPIDVICGALLGTSVGWMIFQLYKKVTYKYA